MKRARNFGGLAVALAAFFLGLLCASLLPRDPVSAAQTFGPEQVKSVPKSFLEGGDRNVAVLSEILSVLKENTEVVKKIESQIHFLNTDVKIPASRGQHE